jgi:hypothetical protein
MASMFQRKWCAAATPSIGPASLGGTIDALTRKISDIIFEPSDLSIYATLVIKILAKI